MSPKALLLLLGAIASEVIATSSLKASQGFTRPVFTAVMVVGYLTAFYLLGIALRTIPVGVAYAIWSGLGTAIVALIGWLAFREALSTPQIAGIVLVVAGVLLLNLTGPAPH